VRAEDRGLPACPEPMMIASYFNFFPRPSGGAAVAEGTTSVTKQEVENPAENAARNPARSGLALIAEMAILLRLEFCFLLCFESLDLISVNRLLRLEIRGTSWREPALGSGCENGS
jgi:hypothetical protein